MSTRVSNQFPVRGEFVSLREAMDNLLSESFVGSPFRSLWSGSTGGNGTRRVGLPLDVFATPTHVAIIAAVPGLGPDNLKVTFDQGTVTIAGELPNVAASEEGKEATWYLHELQHGSFQRSVSLPFDVDVDKAEATFENGILYLRLPKAEQARPKQIKINVTNGSNATEAIEPGAQS